MGMREKLIELIKTASSTCPDGIHKCTDCEYYEKDACGNPCNDQKRIADHLIANGVTIPVRCKDCKKRYNPKECPMCVRVYGEQHDVTHNDGYCDRGERKTE